MAWKRNHACSDFASISKPKISLYLLVRPHFSTSRSFCMWYCVLRLRNSLSNVNLLISLFWWCSSHKLFYSWVLSCPFPTLAHCYSYFTEGLSTEMEGMQFFRQDSCELCTRSCRTEMLLNQHPANNTREKLNTYPLGAGNGYGVAVLCKCLMN